MGEFYAWTATGQVAQLKFWRAPDGDTANGGAAGDDGAVVIATRIMEGQRFVLRQRDGQSVDVVLTDTALRLRNGEVVTTVWAAREGAQHGHCIFLQNHSTGEATRLSDNVKLIRPKVGVWKTARFGIFAAIPVAFTMLMWLLIPGSFEGVNRGVLLMLGCLAIIVLFLVGSVASKLVLDYLRSEDEQKLWLVADRALADARETLNAVRPNIERRS